MSQTGIGPVVVVVDVCHGVTYSSECVLLFYFISLGLDEARSLARSLPSTDANEKIHFTYTEAGPCAAFKSDLKNKAGGQ